MNIQPSVILWTVICFLVLMLVLDRLLFRPVLQLLDERRKNLSEARERKADRARMLEEKAREREALCAECEREKSAQVIKELEQLQAKEKTMLADAHKECLARIDIYREQREKELEEILSAVNPQMARVAELFADRMSPDTK